MLVCKAPLSRFYPEKALYKCFQIIIIIIIIILLRKWTRRAYLKEMGDCNDMAGDNVAKQHRLLVCRITLETRKRKITKAEPRIK